MLLWLLLSYSAPYFCIVAPDTGDIYYELQATLATGDGADRRNRAAQIVQQDIDLAALMPLLFADRKTAQRFAWLLSDIGIASPGKLLGVLSYAFERRHETDIPGFEQQFVKYWRIAGIPEQDKGAAIDLAFQLLTDPKVGPHIKSVSAEILHSMVKAYPDLANELKLCLEEELDKNTDAFRKKAEGILRKL